MSLTAIILAAGKSTRMKSKRPKPLHEICGKPMLDYILCACYEAGCQRVVVVVGYGKDEIVAQFGNDERIEWVEQTEQLGTGHAARMCERFLKSHHGFFVCHVNSHGLASIATSGKMTHGFLHSVLTDVGNNQLAALRSQDLADR